MTRTECTATHIFSLGIGAVTNLKHVLELILPFFNEFANLANIVFFLPVLKKNIYPHHDTLLKLSFDIIALSGICLNVATHTEHTTSWRKGLFKGIVYLVGAFALPNLYMDIILSYFTENKFVKLLIGIIVIYILEVLIHKAICIHDSYIDARDSYTG